MGASLRFRKAAMAQLRYWSFRTRGCAPAPRRWSDFDAALGRLIADMLETMYAAPGIGLAATQVNVHRRAAGDRRQREPRTQPQVFINPQILSARGSRRRPRRVACRCPRSTNRSSAPTRVRVRAQDRHGVSFERDLDGLLAVCVQHEMDHLEGKLFVDYLSSLKRERIRRKLEKEQRERGERRRQRPAAAPPLATPK